MKFPKGVYLVNQPLDSIAQLPLEAEHICIDAIPEAELILRLTLAKHQLYPEIAPKIFGYKYTKEDTVDTYYFLNEEQHVERKNNCSNKDIKPCK